MEPVWSCHILLLLYRPTKNELQTVRIGESGDDQALSLLESIFLFVHVVAGYGGDRLRFHHTIDQNLIHPKIPRPRLLYFHGALFTGWLVFFILQSSLVRTHNVRIHRTIGWFGAGMGALIPLVGVATAVTMVRFDMMQLKINNAATDMIIPMWDMVAFTPAFVLAIYWRKKPEFHRRLILIATCVLTAAGWGRFPEWLPPPVISYAGVDLPILLGVFRDWMVNRKVHLVYSYALPALIAGQTVVMYANVHKSAVG
jgi:hypothetical protein